MSKPEDPVERLHRPVAPEVLTLRDLLKAETNAADEAPGERAQAPPSQIGTVPEIGGRKNGLDPTRYGDWEKDGRCIDF